LFALKELNYLTNVKVCRPRGTFLLQPP
jgi:predicted DNA-binding protein (MmcQ/YjbR family)